ncbi:MAG TPA: hypothetical protein VHO50_06480 [Bacteroidales bacterium]|nr:hypothetical protein [Bacteroidales bacterium]
MFIGSRSRFFEFKEDFIKDTGLKSVEDNLELYTQYVTARFADQNHKLLTELLNEMRELQKNVKKL